MSVDQLYGDLETKFRTARPGEDTQPLREAFVFANAQHEGQLRKSGEPYMVHPLEVAHILVDMQMDMVCLQTGLLHDVVEDTSASVPDVERLFGPEVARCVDGVTKISKLNLHSREDREAESMRKMLLAMVTDIRVILVKLADRLHNMRTLGVMSREQQERTAQETLDIYAPIAHRLGMGKMRGELEDLSFSWLEPEAYAELVQQIEERRQASEETLEKIRKDIQVRLGREGIPARVDGRLKRAWSIYQKLKRQKITLDQVYDVLAVRIITDSLKNCYAALGVIHNEWQPVPGRIKDFIAIPRPNLYQSLHTSVMVPGAFSFEVQIRTEEMHRIAEDGIAAHWKYKEGKKGITPDDQRIAWLRQLVEWQREMREPSDFMSTLRGELYPADEVYTFTPQGKVIVLPRESTPIDFAYAIHSDVGHRCVGAKVNNRIVPLRYSLRNGDVVEILTQAGHAPSRDWLNLVRTGRARNKIRQYINQSAREKAIDIGQKYLEKEARRLGVPLSRVSRADMERVASEYGVGKIEDLHAALGYGRYSARQVLQKLAPDVVPEKEHAPAPVEMAKQPAPDGAPAPQPGVDGRAQPDTGDLIIKVKGIDDMLVYRAKCCNPIRGEAIVGYVTRGKGVAVHSIRCLNVQNLMYEPERKIDVEWTRSANETFQVRMVIHTDDRPGMLNQLTSVLFSENSNIRSLEARSDERNGTDGAIVEMTVEVKDKRQLEKVTGSIRRIAGVRDIERVQ